MTIFDLHIAFQDALDKLSSSSYPEVPQEQADRYLNIGYEYFIKQRYGLSNNVRESFEATQKRVDDLSNLVVYAYLNPAGRGIIETEDVSTTLYPLPDDYWFAVIERVLLGCVPCFEGVDRSVAVQARRHNEVNTLVADPFNKPKDRYTFRIMTSAIAIGDDKGSVIQLFHDKLACPKQYTLGYIQQFKKLRMGDTYQIDTPNGLNYWLTTAYWAPLHAHLEIVNIAAKAAMEAIEHPRYGTFTQEINTQE